jgi:hypothetical protein
VKKVLALFGLAAGLSVSAMAADFSGTIIDEMCSKMPAMKGDVDCANKCIKGGSPAVLVTDDGTIYKIAEQAKVIPQAGKKVTLSGKLDGATNTIHVDKVKL